MPMIRFFQVGAQSGRHSLLGFTVVVRDKYNTVLLFINHADSFCPETQTGVLLLVPSVNVRAQLPLKLIPNANSAISSLSSLPTSLPETSRSGHIKVDIHFSNDAAFCVHMQLLQSIALAVRPMLVCFARLQSSDLFLLLILFPIHRFSLVIPALSVFWVAWAHFSQPSTCGNRELTVSNLNHPLPPLTV